MAEHIPNDFTVSELAARLARVQPEFSEPYYARQIRGWAQARLFLDVRIEGSGRTASQIFSKYDLASARIYGVLTQLGFTAFQLRRLSVILRMGSDHRPTPGLRQVVDAYILSNVVDGHDLTVDPDGYERTKSPWFAVIYFTEAGELRTCRFSRSPDVNPGRSLIAPIVIVLHLGRLFSGLFTNETRAPDTPNEDGGENDGPRE